MSCKPKNGRVGNQNFLPIMKKKSILVGAVLMCLMFTLPTDARNPRNGNYVNSKGCLVVWEAKYFLGIRTSYHETEFCNGDGSPVNFGLAEEGFSSNL